MACNVCNVCKITRDLHTNTPVVCNVCKLIVHVPIRVTHLDD